MFYDFPIINHISDVLPHVTNCEDFVVADKGKYTIINYVLQSSDTFRPVWTETEWTKLIKPPKDWKPERILNYESVIRRECRGITFDNATGKIIRRPYHKFFNVNEREETIGLDLTWDAVILDKLDGSMIVPFCTSDGVLRWGTKMGETDTSAQLIPFLAAHPEYERLAYDSIHVGITPIFEWMSKDNRIVIDYGEPSLVLTAARNMVDGTYIPRVTMELTAANYNVPLVNMYHSNVRNMEKLVEEARSEVGLEGYVIRYGSGHMVKVKSDWYVAIHKAKEKILYERYIADMILNNQIDDILPFLLDSDREKLTKYADSFIKEVTEIVKDLGYSAYRTAQVERVSRKDFALNYAKYYGPFASIIFRHYDLMDSYTLSSWIGHFTEEVKQMIIKNCSSNSKFESFKKAVGFRVEW